MPVYGRRPGDKDLSWGWLYGGNSRASIMGRPPENGWLYSIGGRVGYTDAPSDFQLAAYAVSGSTVTTLLASTNPFRVSTYMIDHWSGADYVRPVATPLQVYSTREYALSASAFGGGQNAFGQDVSGHPMHDNNAILPNPYNADSVTPQGRMSLWANIQTNRRPDEPTGLAPAGITIDNTPRVGCDFRDPDETLPGFGIGDADKLKRYRFQVLNSAATTVLHDSGLVTASAAQQTARRAEWDVPAGLEAGTYVVRATVYDMFDTPSRTAEWAFTVNAGGTFLNPRLHENHVVAPGEKITNVRSPFFVAEWSHSGALNATAIEARIRNLAGTIIRPAFSYGAAVAPGASYTFNYTGTGWEPLAPGEIVSVEMRGRDTTGLWSPWQVSSWIVINAAPNVPRDMEPGPNTVTDNRPTLSAVITDATDTTASLDTTFVVRPEGDATRETIIGVGEAWSSGDRWYAAPDAAAIPGYGVYEWRVQADDRWGLVGPWSPWQRFTYALPPQITVTAPTHGSTIENGTPTISFTADKTITSFSVSIRDAETGSVAHTSGEVTSTGPGGDYAVPTGVLRNETTYTATIAATDTVGLTSTVAVTFTVSYPAPAALASITVEKTPGPFEHAGTPEEWSRLAIGFAEAPVADVSDEDFAGSLLRRIDEGTGEEVLLAHMLTRGETYFVDKTVASRTSYRYVASYLKVVNGVDIVESVPVEAAGSVTLQHTTLTSMDDDDLGAPLRYWKGRDVEWVTDVEIVPSWGPEPIGFMGPADSLQIDGDFAVLDADDGSFTATEIVREVRRMATPRRTGERSIAPRVVYYRDSRGRAFFAMIESGGEEDEHTAKIGRMDLTITQVTGEEGVTL